MQSFNCICLSAQFVQGEGDAGHLVTREYALFCHGRFVSQATGEHNYYPTRGGMTFGKACESAKSNALMRCCKDLGIASDLWDPQVVTDHMFVLCCVNDRNVHYLLPVCCKMEGCKCCRSVV